MSWSKVAFKKRSPGSQSRVNAKLKFKFERKVEKKRERNNQNKTKEKEQGQPQPGPILFPLGPFPNFSPAISHSSPTH
jgi:hypothetical protein